MFKVEKVTDEKGRVWLQDPQIARYLFQSTATAWLWLAVRLYVGYQFLMAGLDKFSSADWMAGHAILGFWRGALGTTLAGKPVITFDWYRSFIQLLVDTNSAGWFSYVIVFGALAVGIALLLGAFVGFAAHGGVLMNMAYMLSGVTGINPVLTILGVLLILAWKNAGYLGFDRFLLPLRATYLHHPAVAPVAGRVPTPSAAAD
jgi:thiosulfate dehydrogenase [quinone] large subunit